MIEERVINAIEERISKLFGREPTRHIMSNVWMKAIGHAVDVYVKIRIEKCGALRLNIEHVILKTLCDDPDLIAEIKEAKRLMAEVEEIILSEVRK